MTINECLYRMTNTRYYDWVNFWNNPFDGDISDTSLIIPLNKASVEVPTFATSCAINQLVHNRHIEANEYTVAEKKDLISINLKFSYLTGTYDMKKGLSRVLNYIGRRDYNCNRQCYKLVDGDSLYYYINGTFFNERKVPIAMLMNKLDYFEDEKAWGITNRIFKVSLDVYNNPRTTIEKFVVKKYLPYMMTDTRISGLNTYGSNRDVVANNGTKPNYLSDEVTRIVIENMDYMIVRTSPLNTDQTFSEINYELNSEILDSLEDLTCLP